MVRQLRTNLLVIRVREEIGQKVRMVLLWSREPWQQVDDVGSDAMPPGKFVSGVTRTPLGRAVTHRRRFNVPCGTRSRPVSR